MRFSVTTQPVGKSIAGRPYHAMEPSESPVYSRPIELCAALRHFTCEIESSGLQPEPRLGLAMALTMLFAHILKFDSGDPFWPDRDRVILADPGSGPLLDAVVRLIGPNDLGLRWNDQLAPSSSPAPEAPAAIGGQALAMAAGMALAERALAARFGKSLIDHRIWTIIAAEQLTQGLSYEVAALAGQLRLDRLAVLVDATAVSDEDARACYASFGWAVKSVQADAVEQIGASLSSALRSRKPTLIWCTGAPVSDGGAVPGATTRTAWQRIGRRGAAARRSWLKRVVRHPLRTPFERAGARRLPDGWHEMISALRSSTPADSPLTLSRQLLDRAAGCMPEIVCGHVGGSTQGFARSTSFEHRPYALAACANGVTLHGTTLAVTLSTPEDTWEQLPALRLAALLLIRSVHLVVGSPCEVLLSCLRAIPNLNVFWPRDAMDTLNYWDDALRGGNRPSVLILEA